MSPWVFSSGVRLFCLGQFGSLDFVTPGSLVMAAESSFSFYRCWCLFGAGGTLARAELEANLGHNVILHSPAFTQKIPMPPANQGTGEQQLL